MMGTVSGIIRQVAAPAVVLVSSHYILSENLDHLDKRVFKNQF